MTTFYDVSQFKTHTYIASPQNGIQKYANRNHGHLLDVSYSSSTWLDTKIFPIIQITASLDDKTSHMYWHKSHDETPTNGEKVAFRDSLNVDRGTIEVDSRARWVKIVNRGSDADELSYVLKPKPTGIKIVDDNGSITSVTSNAMNIVYRDTNNILGTTNEATTDTSGIDKAGALHTILTDRNGNPLDVVHHDTLCVALADGNGNTFSSTNVSIDREASNGHGANEDNTTPSRNYNPSIDTSYTSHNSLSITITNSGGMVQAGSSLSEVENINDQLGGTQALYYSLCDISGKEIGSTKTINDTSNALCVHLTGLDGSSHNIDNPIPIKIVGDSVRSEVVDTRIGDSTIRLVNINNNEGKPINIESLSLANETPVPVWFKLYDAYDGYQRLSEALEVNGAEQRSGTSSIQNSLKLNMAVAPLSVRDVHIRKGMVFYNGILSRVSNVHHYDSSIYGLLGTDEQTFVTVNYAPILQSEQQQDESILYKEFIPEWNRNGSTLSQANTSNFTPRPEQRIVVPFSAQHSNDGPTILGWTAAVDNSIIVSAVTASGFSDDAKFISTTDADDTGGQQIIINEQLDGATVEAMIANKKVAYYPNKDITINPYPMIGTEAFTIGRNLGSNEITHAYDLSLHISNDGANYLLNISVSIDQTTPNKHVAKTEATLVTRP